MKPACKWLVRCAAGIFIGATLLAFPRTDHPASVESIAPAQTCANPSYTVRILNYDPLVIHIEDFFSLDERRQLASLARPRLKRSTVKDAYGNEHVIAGRTSSTAKLPLDDPIVTCVRARAAQFQGLRTHENVSVEATFYQAGEEFRPHWDWKHGQRAEDRVSTFFGILDASCRQCGTRFPLVPNRIGVRDTAWCNLVQCEDPALTVQAIPGSAVFWRNLFTNGSGDERTLHSGLPAMDGVKEGLNLWTRIAV